MRTFFSWLVAITLIVLRSTCRVRVANDIRPALRRSSIPYVFAILHSHQFAALMVSEKGLGAMVSRSADGEMIVPSLTLCGCVPVRGSSGQGTANRGGRTALRNLIRHVRNGRPACLTVDGPRGPRGRVHKGIGDLSRQSDAVVLAAVVVPRRRWIVSKAWDRMQVPKPFTTIDLYFSLPLTCGEDETLETYRRRIQETLAEIESLVDPEEFTYSEPRLPGPSVLRKRAAKLPPPRSSAA